MDKREERKYIARQTVQIAQDGWYTAGKKKVNIKRDVDSCLKQTEFYSEEKTSCLEQNFVPKEGMPAIELRNESTLAAILRSQNEQPLGVLNFASAKHPGGGFLNGAMAQEESLATASCLYQSQLKHPSYYGNNKICGTFCYTDCAIWSPDVVLFRDDVGTLMENPAKASMLTLPAVNYGQVVRFRENAEQAKATMKRRMKITLAVFAEKGYKTVVLGAYGCGVFKNDPVDVVGWWHELLTEYGGHFDKVIFAVLDHSPVRDTLVAFERKWGTVK